MSGNALHLPFVGRRREQSAFGAALTRAIAGHGSVVIFEGEQGCGKTAPAGRAPELV